MTRINGQCTSITRPYQISEPSSSLSLSLISLTSFPFFLFIVIYLKIYYYYYHYHSLHCWYSFSFKLKQKTIAPHHTIITFTSASTQSYASVVRPQYQFTISLPHCHLRSILRIFLFHQIHILFSNGKASISALMSVDIRQSLTCLRYPSRFEALSRTQLSKEHSGDLTRPIDHH